MSSEIIKNFHYHVCRLYEAIVVDGLSNNVLTCITCILRNHLVSTLALSLAIVLVECRNLGKLAVRI